MKIVSIFSKFRAKDLDAVIAGCLLKDEHCQQLLFKKFAPKILTTCRRYETAWLGAGDILQETFITVFEKIAQYDPSKGAIDTWINRIAINTALKALRKKQTALVDIDLLPDIADEAPDENTTMDDISEEYLLGLIQALPVGYRTVFNLYVIDGFGHQEIADTLGISPQTSKSQLFKAKAMLRRNLTTEKKTLKELISKI